jgi:hypothetical protein
MQVEEFLTSLVEKFPVAGLILTILGILVVVAEIIVVLTPSQKDDAAWAKIKGVPVLGQLLAFLASMAPIRKK